MANVFPSQVKVHPSFSEPDLILTYAQPSGAFSTLADGKPRVKLAQDDLYVYVNTLDIRTDAKASQSSFNAYPSANLVAGYVSTQTYRVGCGAIYNRDDMQAASRYAISLPHAQDFAIKQGIFQQLRNGLLYGFTPSNGEGLLNASGATAVTLPPDSYGNTTLRTYDNGQIALWLLTQIESLKTSMFQYGYDIHNKIVLLAPQRILGTLMTQNIVQVTSYQRPGAGTSSSLDVIKRQLEDFGDKLEWCFDDTLIGKGASGDDMMVMTIPEIETPRIPGINTGMFNEVKPALNDINLMYADLAIPVKIQSPMPNAAIREVQEIRVTAGWNARGAGIYLLSIPY